MLDAFIVETLPDGSATVKFTELENGEEVYTERKAFPSVGKANEAMFHYLSEYSTFCPSLDDEE